LGIGRLPLESFQAFGNEISGTIPLAYQFLSNLQSIGLEQNLLTGEIPSQVLAGWGNVIDLNLGDNVLQGDIPPTIGVLSNLEILELYFNILSGELPFQLGGLSAAREIYLESNLFSGTIPRSLGFLSNLEVLHLHDNDLSGEVPPELCDLVDNGLDLAIDCFLIDCPCACNCDLSSRR
jgi:hypothetical protein